MYPTIQITNDSKVNNEVKDCIICVDSENIIINLSEYGMHIFEFVNCVSICGLVSLFGISANIINIIIFYNQGFTNTVNIAFLGLAISDLCCLIALEWYSICLNPLLPVTDVTWAADEVMFLSAAWPHIGFSRITGFITVYITAERFISIALPLKVKQIFTAKRTTLIISLIYTINIMALVQEYATSHLGWRYIKKKNKTLIGITFTSSRKDFDGLCYVFHSFLSATSFVGVIIFTIALVIKLRKTSEWRKITASSHQAISVSNKEQKTGKMVVLIATVLIVCYTPGALLALITFILGPEFNITGRYMNFCVAIWSVAFCFHSINSSVNIFLYYKMSSKYRTSFNDIVLNCRKLNK